MKRLNVIILLLLAQICFAQETEFSASGTNVLRIENEIKLTIPDELSDSVWNYLKWKYSNDNLTLKSIDSSFNSQMAEDLFIDQYFDNKNFQLFNLKCGVRHRFRSVLTDSTSRKDGKELMQIKINNIGENILSRGEYKYKIKHYDKKKKKLDSHPFLGLVKRKQRDDITERLKEYNINANDLYPTIRIEQHRKRIYLLRDTIPFSTITFDMVSAFYEQKTTKFIELELELNEIGYTESDSLSRQKMEQINEIIKSDILNRFPSIKQDQTPKYNKAANALGVSYKPLTNSFTYYWILGCLFFGIIVFLIIKKKYKGSINRQ